MAIFSRMFRLCKADLHGVMDQLEDKGLLLKQYLREMEESLAQKADRLAAIEGGCRKIQGDIERRTVELEKTETDLELAVRKDKDEIARMLIRKRWTLEKSRDQIKHQLQVMEEKKAHVAERLATQRMQFDELKVRAAAFCQASDPPDWVLDGPGAEAPVQWQSPSEEEVDLELLQRKGALRQGGAA